MPHHQPCSLHDTSSQVPRRRVGARSLVAVVMVAIIAGCGNPNGTCDEPCVPDTAAASSAFITGYDTADMRAVLQTDPAVSGTYKVTFRLFGGNSVAHRINTG